MEESVDFGLRMEMMGLMMLLLLITIIVEAVRGVHAPLA